ncbi:hypothetical protein B0H11DRAFT_1679510, partial [Mycena galericulata]
WGFLYAVACQNRRSVSVPYKYGVDKVQSTNDLFTHAWVPHATPVHNIMDASVGRVHVTVLPGGSTPLKFPYTIFYFPPGAYSATDSRNECRVLVSDNAVFENILVVKHGKRKAIINME